MRLSHPATHPVALSTLYPPLVNDSAWHAWVFLDCRRTLKHREGQSCATRTRLRRSGRRSFGMHGVSGQLPSTGVPPRLVSCAWARGTCRCRQRSYLAPPSPEPCDLDVWDVGLFDLGGLPACSLPPWRWISHGRSVLFYICAHLFHPPGTFCYYQLDCCSCPHPPGKSRTLRGALLFRGLVLLLSSLRSLLSLCQPHRLFLKPSSCSVGILLRLPPLPHPVHMRLPVWLPH